MFVVAMSNAVALLRASELAVIQRGRRWSRFDSKHGCCADFGVRLTRWKWINMGLSLLYAPGLHAYRYIYLDLGVWGDGGRVEVKRWVALCSYQLFIVFLLWVNHMDNAPSSDNLFNVSFCVHDFHVFNNNVKGEKKKDQCKGLKEESTLYICI